MRVLIADDDLATLRLEDIVLSRHGYQTELARTGQEALDILSVSKDVGLALLDVVLPGVDGIEVLGEMRSRLEWRNIPVVMSTVVAELNTVEKVSRLGSANYLVKPVSEEQLLLSVQAALHEAPSPAYLKPLPKTGQAAEARDPGVASIPPDAVTMEQALARQLDLLGDVVRGKAPSMSYEGLQLITDHVARTGDRQAALLLERLSKPQGYDDQRAMLADYLQFLAGLNPVEQRLVAA